MEAVGRGCLANCKRPRAVDKWLRAPTAPVAHDPSSCRGAPTGRLASLALCLLFEGSKILWAEEKGC